LIPFLLLAQRSEHASSNKRHQEEMFVSFHANRSEEPSWRWTEEDIFPGAQAISNCSSIPPPSGPNGKNHLLRAKLQLLYTAVIITTKHFFLYPKTLFFFSHRDSWVALPTLVSPVLRKQAGRRLEDCFFFSFSIYLGRGPGGMPWGGNTSLKNPSLYLIS
jgi:hypothetical protein